MNQTSRHGTTATPAHTGRFLWPGWRHSSRRRCARPASTEHPADQQTRQAQELAAAAAEQPSAGQRTARAAAAVLAEPDRLAACAQQQIDTARRAAAAAEQAKAIKERIEAASRRGRMALRLAGTSRAEQDTLLAQYTRQMADAYEEQQRAESTADFSRQRAGVRGVKICGCRLASVDAGGQAVLPLEGRAERELGCISDPVGHGLERSIGVAEEPGCGGHAPPGQVRQRWLTYQGGEPPCECRSRQTRQCSQLSHRPRSLRRAVNALECGVDGRVVQGRGPAGGCIVPGPLIEPGPHDVQQQGVEQCGQQGVTAEPGLCQFGREKFGGSAQ